VTEWLERSSLVLKIPGSKQNLAQDFSKTLSIHPAMNGYLALFTAAEGEKWLGRRVTPRFIYTVAVPYRLVH